MSCCVGDLRNKDVVNICDGKRLGCIVDIDIDVCNGRLCYIIVPGNEKLFNFTNKGDLRIPWDRIRKIGDDTILVELPDENDFTNNKKPDKRR